VTGPAVSSSDDRGLATVIASPLASRIRDPRVRASVLRRTAEALAARGHREVAVVEASTPPTIRDAVRGALRDGSTVIVIAGGDGTVRDAAGILVDHGVTVGIVPCGTGNLYAVSVGVPRETDAAIAALRSGTTRRFDMGEVRMTPFAAGPAEPAGPDTEPETGASPFMVACGTGLDARLIEGVSADMKRRYGVAAYFFAAGRLLPHLRPNATILTIDGVRTELESVVVLVANCGEAVPGRLRPRLPIDPSDGLLHVFVLPRGGIVRGIRGVLELMTTQATGISPSGSAIRLAGADVHVEVTPAQPTQVDGDPFPGGSIHARIRPAALAVIVP
jgi:diacylglycerol kinase (ATP)